MLRATKSLVTRASDPIPSALLSESLWRDISDAKNAADKILSYSFKRSQSVHGLRYEFWKEWNKIETGSVEKRDAFLKDKTEGPENMVREWNEELERVLGLVGLADLNGGGGVEGV
jgi:hypothetical protein